MDQAQSLHVRVCGCVSACVTSSLVSLLSLSRGSCLICVAMAKAARSWLSARLMTLVIEGSIDPWQLVLMMVFLSHTASNSWGVITPKTLLVANDRTFLWVLNSWHGQFLKWWHLYHGSEELNSKDLLLNIPQCTVWSRSGFPWPPSFENRRYTEASRKLSVSWRHQTPQKTLLWCVAESNEGLRGRLAPILMWCHFLKGSHLCKMKNYFQHQDKYEVGHKYNLFLLAQPLFKEACLTILSRNT